MSLGGEESDVIHFHKWHAGQHLNVEVLHNQALESERLTVSGEGGVDLAYHPQMGGAIGLANGLCAGKDLGAEASRSRVADHVTGGTTVYGDAHNVMVVEYVDVG